MTSLLLAAVVAQGLDAFTMNLSLEGNPVVLALGPRAYLAKMLLILVIPLLAWALLRLPVTPRGWWTFATFRRRQFAARAMAWAAVIVGLTGTLSNLR